MAKTIYSIDDVHVQVMYPSRFIIESIDDYKKDYAKRNKAKNFFNLGYFAQLSDGKTMPVGNLVIDGKVITDSDSQAGWLNTYNHILTTLVIYNDDRMEFVQTNDMHMFKNVKYAISGIPIIRNGYKVSMEDIKREGYFGTECYDTWHGFLGIRGDQLVYVAAKVNFERMVYLLEVLGIKDAIKVDGGGSFILHNNYDFEIKTSENRRINTIGRWW